MTLAGMIAKDEGALTCDFAETYGVYDYKVLPPQLAATLAAGLRETSRIRMALNGQRANYSDILLAAIFDQLRIFAWDGKGERPESVVQAMMGDEPKDESKYQTFDSLEAFNEARNKILGAG